MTRARLATLAAMALALTAVAAPAAQAATTIDPTKTYLVDCGGAPKVKPKTIMLACGDGGVFIKKITWSSWDANGATGIGTLVSNVCVPNCAAGNVDTYKGVKLTLGGVASGTGVSVFSHMDGQFKGDGGPAMANRVTWVIDNPVKQ